MSSRAADITCLPNPNADPFLRMQPVRVSMKAFDFNQPE